MSATRDNPALGAAQEPERIPLASNPTGGAALKPPDYGTMDIPASTSPLEPSGSGSRDPETVAPPTSNATSTRPKPYQKDADGSHGETFDNVPADLRRLGLFSATALIFNFVIGTGIYASPGAILQAAGSVGVALIMWVLGTLIAAAGTFVYVEYGTGLPKSGGEKNYLEFTFNRPQYLMTSIFAAYSTVSRSSADSSIVFGTYALRSLGIEPTPSNVRQLAYYCLSFVTFVHGANHSLGIQLQNVLGVFKIVLLVGISVVGLLSLAGVKGFQGREGYENPHNFDWNNFWDGTNFDPHGFSTGVYNVLWAFVGYQNANYALSEVKNPVLTLKKASVLGISIVATLYILVNIAFFAVVSKKDMLDGSNVVVSLFFRNLFGDHVERVLSFFVALSVLGSVLAGQFTQGRVIQELGREGIFPASKFLASSKPFNTPFAGLFIQYVISCALLFVTRPGDGFQFLVRLGCYCIFIVDMLVSIGLLLIHVKGYSAFQWNPPVRSPRWIVIAYFVSNVFLLIVPLIPPREGMPTYENLPYWSHAVAAFGVSLVGIAYWYWFAVWHPWKWGYFIQRELVVTSTGLSRYTLLKVPAQFKMQSGPGT